MVLYRIETDKDRCGTDTMFLCSISGFCRRWWVQSSQEEGNKQSLRVQEQEVKDEWESMGVFAPGKEENT